MKKRLLSMLLVVCMTISVPQTAYCMESSETVLQEENTAELVELEEESEEKTEEEVSKDTAESAEASSAEEATLEEATLEEETSLDEETEEAEEFEEEIAEDNLADTSLVNELSTNIIQAKKDSEGYINFSTEAGTFKFKDSKAGILHRELTGTCNLKDSYSQAKYRIVAWYVYDELNITNSLNLVNGSERSKQVLLQGGKTYKCFYTFNKGNTCLGKLKIDNAIESEVKIESVASNKKVLISDVSYDSNLKYTIERIDSSIVSYSIGESNISSTISKDYYNYNSSTKQKASYEFRFYDVGGNFVTSETVTFFEDFGDKCFIDVKAGDKPNDIVIDAKVDNVSYSSFMDSTPKYINFNYTIYDEEDYVTSSLPHFSKTWSVDTGKKTIIFDEGNVYSNYISSFRLLANKEYRVTADITLTGENGKHYTIAYCDKVIKTGSSKNAKISDFTVTTNYDDANQTLKYTVSSKSIPKNTPIKYSYKYKNTEGFPEDSGYNTPKTNYEATLPSKVVQGEPFTMYFYYDGRVYTKEYVFGTQKYSLEVVEGNSQDGVYCDNIKQSLKFSANSGDLNGEYRLCYNIYDKTADILSKWSHAAQKLNASNNYTGRTSFTSYWDVFPDRDYVLYAWVEDINGNVLCYMKKDYHTLKLDLKAAFDSIDENGYTKFKIYGDLSNSYSGSIKVPLFIREKKTNATMRQVGSTYIFSSGKNSTAYITSQEALSPGKTYELIIYFYSSSIPYELYRGEYKCPVDNTKLEVTSASASRNELMLEYKITNYVEGNNPISSIFVREAGMPWEYVGFNSNKNGLTYSEVISKYDGKAIKDNTSYDIAVGLGNVTSFNDLTNPIVKSVTTKEDTRKVTYLSISPSKDSAQFMFTYFQGEAETTASHLHISYRAKGTSGWSINTIYIDKGAVDRTFLTSLKNLEGKKIYEYQIRSVSTEIHSADETADVKVLKTGTFETPIVPTSITLNESSIRLNVTGTNTYQLKLGKVLPSDASTDLVWSTENSSVATVDSNGLVTAKAYGETTIKATSKYDSSVYSTCKVTVNNYVVGKLSSDGKFESASNKTIYLTKKAGEKTVFDNDIRLYDKVGSTYKLVEDYTVEPEKSGIIEVNSKTGQLTACCAGSVIIYYCKDEVKLPVTYNVKYDKYDLSIESVKTDGQYEAVIESDKYIFAEGSTYTLGFGLSPAYNYGTNNYTYTIKDTSIVSVDSEGKLSALKAGSTKIKISTNNIKSDGIEITVVVKKLPASIKNKNYTALINTQKTIGEVSIADDWRWVNPKASLVVSEMATGTYYFEAEYVGDKYFPVKELVPVKVGQITVLSLVKKDSGDTSFIVEENEEGILTYKLIGNGYLEGDYSLELTGPKNVVLEKVSNSQWKLSSAKAGNYKVSGKLYTTINGKKILLASSSRVINVVEKAQVEKIQLSSTDVKIIDNLISFETLTEGKTFTLNAKALDKNGKLSDTPLTFVSSNKKVCTVAADKTGSTCSVTLVGEGCASILVTAKDTKKTQVTLSIEIRDYKPKLNSYALTINNMLNYSASKNTLSVNLFDGYYLNIYPVYNESIQEISVYDDKELTKISEKFAYKEYYPNNFEYLIRPIDPDIKPGKYMLYLKVKAGINGKTVDYSYPITVTVVSKKPGVVITQNNTLNLFYNSFSSNFTINSKGAETLSTAKIVGEGFSTTNNANYTDLDNRVEYQCKLISTDAAVLKGKALDKSCATVKIYTYFSGYRNPVITEYKLKTEYKAPKLTLSSASTVVYPYGKKYTNTISYKDSNNPNKTGIDYQIESRTDNVTATISKDAITYTVNDSFRTSKARFIISSPQWRDSIAVTHTITVRNPNVINKKILIDNSQFVFNNNFGDACFWGYIRSDYSTYNDIVVKGANATSQTLLDTDKVTVKTYSGGSVNLYINDPGLAKYRIKAGNYSFKVTPFINHPVTGEKLALNAATMTVKVVDALPTITTKITGNTDMNAHNNYDYYTRINSTLSNMTTNYTIKDISLDGDYMNNFEYKGWFYEQNECITGNRTDELILYYKREGSLKPNTKYLYTIMYTVSNNKGSSFTVKSKPQSMTLKKTCYGTLGLKPVVLCADNSETMSAYVSESKYNDKYVPAYAEGGIDIDKDGKNDIVVSYDDSKSKIKVSIVNKYAIPRNPKGTTYKIPVKIRLSGSDTKLSNTKVTLEVRVY